MVFPSELSGTFDLAFLAVRSEGTKDALDSLSDHLADDALMVPLQNGLNLPLLVTRVADAKMPVIWESEANRRLFADFISEIIFVGEAAGARFEKLAEYDPNEFHPSRSLAQRIATVEEMARTWKDEKETGGGLKRGEKTEVDGIIGCVIREGERLGVPTPLCRATLRVYLEIEKRQRAIGKHNYRELYGILH